MNMHENWERKVSEEKEDAKMQDEPEGRQDQKRRSHNPKMHEKAGAIAKRGRASDKTYAYPR
jgi:hypothetical protein